MGWFAQLCRNTGLMIHHVIKPEGEPHGAKRELHRSVEERRIDATTTLRRTVIDEIEVREPPARDPRN